MPAKGTNDWSATAPPGAQANVCGRQRCRAGCRRAWRSRRSSGAVVAWWWADAALVGRRGGDAEQRRLLRGQRRPPRSRPIGVGPERRLLVRCSDDRCRGVVRPARPAGDRRSVTRRARRVVDGGNSSSERSAACRVVPGAGRHCPSQRGRGGRTNRQLHERQPRGFRKHRRGGRRGRRIPATSAAAVEHRRTCPQPAAR